MSCMAGTLRPGEGLSRPPRPASASASRRRTGSYDGSSSSLTSNAVRARWLASRSSPRRGRPACRHRGSRGVPRSPRRSAHGRCACAVTLGVVEELVEERVRGAVAGMRREQPVEAPVWSPPAAVFLRLGVVRHLGHRALEAGEVVRGHARQRRHRLPPQRRGGAPTTDLPPRARGAPPPLPPPPAVLPPFPRSASRPRVTVAADPSARPARPPTYRVLPSAVAVRAGYANRAVFSFLPPGVRRRACCSRRRRSCTCR